MVILIASRRQQWSRRNLALFALIGLTALAVAIGWMVLADGATPDAKSSPPQPSIPDRRSISEGPVPRQQSSIPPGVSPVEDGPVRIGTVKPFRSDASGALLLDEDTVVTLEQLVAFSTPDQLKALAREAAAGLPPSLQAEALELAQQFDRYQEAVRQRIQSEQAPTTVDDMARDLQALQEMRQHHFGDQAALQMFGDQEAVTARLIELMRQDTLFDGPLEERAMRAQARWLAERNERDGSGG